MTVRVMTGRPRRRGSSAPARHAWLELVATTGPFLTLPVVDRVLPAGPPAVAPATRGKLRTLMAAMLADGGASRHEVIDAVLTDALDWAGHARSGTDLPDALSETLPDRGIVLRPDLAFYAEEDADGAIAIAAPATATSGSPLPGLGDDPENGEAIDGDGTADSETGDPWRLLGMVSPWGANPVARVELDGWVASPAERLAALLRARDIPVGLVTDGRWWTIVWAPRGATMATGTWDASLWAEEPETLAGFAALLERARFLAVASADRLPALFTESLARQEEITETLGRQVRDAVELLVGALDTLDEASGRRLLAGVSDDELYDGAVTAMMRLVFLLFAEERRLLPSDHADYLDAYAAGRLVDDLESRAALAGEDDLEHRSGAWHRLLAVSRAVHSGVFHEDLRLPAYGGSLFDPDRFPWLEGRQPGDPLTASPPPVDDRTVLAMLRAVQYVTIGGERRRLSFRALDVEQIGYVYEGLLELEVRTATETTLLLDRLGTKKPKHPAEVPATDWEQALDELTPAEQESWLAERTGSTATQARRILDAKPTADQLGELRRACGPETDLVEITECLIGALRRDHRGLPFVAHPGRRYLAPSTRRAATGTHYTPRSLATDIAEHTLEPLVYRPGPLETAERAAWRLRPSTEILALRVADIAMGSGAFLVAACRYLADRLVEAWHAEGRADATRAIARRSGRTVGSDAEIEDVLLDARRLVTEHCLYGVDINPLAVEMAKLSLWLVTMDRERPFGFLDDRLRAGDTLLGVASLDQLETLHLDPAAGRRLGAGRLFHGTDTIRRSLADAADIRRRITAQPVVTARDADYKGSLLAEAERLTAHLHVVADAVTAEGLVSAGRSRKDSDARFVLLADRVERAAAAADTDLRREADTELQRGQPTGIGPRQPLHWPLAFPEILADTPDPGFDAIIGNPPFSGGHRISNKFGDDYLRWLQHWLGAGVKGGADIVAYFLLRANALLNRRGQLGLIAINTIVEGGTLRVGLLPACERDLTIRRARASHKWPTRSANIQIVDLWASRTPLGPDAVCWLDGDELPRIGPDLQPVGTVPGRPERLAENKSIAFKGAVVLGLGFTLTHEQAGELIRHDPRNAEVIQPYVIGQDLNQRPDCSASRHVINFREWPLEQCEQYPDLLDIVHRKVKPEREKQNPEKYPRMVYEWWKFWQTKIELYDAIIGLDHLIALAQTSSTVMPVRINAAQTFDQKCVVFATDRFADLAVLSSGVHTAWTVRYTSTMRTDISYAPSDVFLTLPRPPTTPELDALGESLDADRRVLMLGRGWGLTTTYNHVHDPADRDPAVVHLREVHEAIDRAVFAAYGWDDLDPEIGHHRTKIGIRWTFSPAVRFEVLDRLLAENHRRHDAEQA